ncbi:isopenicillin N synthase family dioxygenase [Granulosicoccus sp. 3-233]|uniref:isopenicillin N synthase family dioxygenase n=1 Tax=Granulosicoccus sp. 3-233 TaxID=3417969 RepID=UPI003D33BDE3
MSVQARQTLAEHIPVIDLSPLTSAAIHAADTGNDSAAGVAAREVAAALHAASQGLGFIYIKGHGIPQHCIDDARRCAYDFFRADDEHKAAVSVSAQHRGWLRPGGARMQDDAPVDLKESFIWGHEDRNGRTESDHPLRGPNQWPGNQPQLQTSAMHYFREAHEVAYRLMQGFALGLDLPANFFLQRCERPISRGSFVYYPPQETRAGEQFGVGPHTDFGVLTVLCQDDVGGLQVQDVKGDWIEAPPMEGTLVVNVGDLLSRWTEGAYKSTPHRVINSSGRERLSLVLAFDPDPETLIDARDVFGPEHIASQPAISCGDYLLQRFARAFAYRDNPTTTA